NLAKDEAKKLEQAKIDATTEISELEGLTEAEGLKAQEEIEKATTVEEVTKALEAAKALSESNLAKDNAKKLQDTKANAKTEISKLVGLTEDEITKAQAEVEKATTVEEVTKALEAAKELSEKNIEKNNKIKFEDYKKYADAFYYKDYDVINRTNDRFFINVNGSKELIGKNGVNFITGVSLGGNHKFKNSDLSIGAFAEYQNRISHNVGIGASLKYKEFDSFIRYRLAEYDKKLNHNVDIYARYSKNFNFGKLNIKPIIGTYLTYSSKVELDDKVYLKDRVGFDVNLGTNISYEVLPKLNIYAEPNVSGGYNNQVLSTFDSKETNKVVRSYFDYNLKLGTKYEVNGFVLNPEFKLNGDLKKNIQVGANLNIGYNW
ncbi:GA module-containing protein, partial [Oceanivirga salmonicida]|uniref:GA module-containing protein n=1 Tax=Oceanivirga salmonicida TaxID=1769291 RepID=UPI0012E21405